MKTQRPSTWPRWFAAFLFVTLGCGGSGGAGATDGDASSGGTAGTTGTGSAGTGTAGTASGTSAGGDMGGGDGGSFCEAPAAEGHPRIHVTASTLPTLREALSTHYADRYQEYVDWAAAMDDADDNNVLGEAAHDPLRALMVHQAFISLVGEIPGVTLPISPEMYARRAIDRLKARLDAGDTLSYVPALVYDWAYHAMTEAERADLAEALAAREITHKLFSHTVEAPDFAPDELFSSKYYESCYAFYVGLALRGEHPSADGAVATFGDAMANYGYLDAANFAAGHDGGWAEWIGYSSWHPRTHFLLVDGHRTATGENYFGRTGQVDGNAVAHYPELIHYAVDPFPYYGDQYTYLRLGASQTTDASLRHRSMREQLYFLGRPLSESCMDRAAGLVRDFVDRYDVAWPSYEHYYLWAFLGVIDTVAPVSPDEAGLESSRWFRNSGMFAARSGFSGVDDGVFVVTDGHYRFVGHDGVDDFPGFTLARYGELVNTRNVAHRGYGNLNDYEGAEQMNVVAFEGGHLATASGLEGPSDLEAAVTGAEELDHGGIEQVSKDGDVLMHVRTDRSRTFTDGARHIRHYVWVPSHGAGESDVLVVHDWASAPTSPRWIYHVPWQPTVSGFDSSVSLDLGAGETGRIGTAYTGSLIRVEEHNGDGGEQDNDGGTQDNTAGAGARGVLFATTVLPETARVEVTRVAVLDNDVVNRQGDLALKAHRWQVATVPTGQATEQVFLHVLETADENLVPMASQVQPLLIAGAAADGVWVSGLESRPAMAVLFPASPGQGLSSVTWTTEMAGKVRHVIVGAGASMCTLMVPGGDMLEVSALADVELWSYPSGEAPRTHVIVVETDAEAGTFTLTCP